MSMGGTPEIQLPASSRTGPTHCGCWGSCIHLWKTLHVSQSCRTARNSKTKLNRNVHCSDLAALQGWGQLWPHVDFQESFKRRQTITHLCTHTQGHRFTLMKLLHWDRMMRLRGEKLGAFTHDHRRIHAGLFKNGSSFKLAKSAILGDHRKERENTEDV